MSITFSITGSSEVVTFKSESSASFDVSNLLVTTETITSTGTRNSALLSNTGGAVTDLNFTGGTYINTSIASAFIPHLNSINASKDTGGFFIDTSLGTLKPTFTFTGGSGHDTLLINTASLDALNAGSQLNGGSAKSGNVLALNSLGTLTGTSASTGEYLTLNAVKGFQVLGVNGTGNNAVINDAYLTNTASSTHTSELHNGGSENSASSNHASESHNGGSENSGFATHVLDAQNGGSLSVTNLGSIYTLDITGSGTNFTLGSAASSQTALTVNLEPSDSNLPLATGVTVGTLATTGGTITKVALTSNEATSVNTITSYHGSDNQTLTINGHDALTIKSVTANILHGDSVNASEFSQALTLGTIGGTNTVAVGAGDTGKGDLIKLGSGTSYLAVSSVGTGDIITLLSGHKTSDTIDTTLIASAIAATAYTSAAAQQADITQIKNFHTNSDILKVGIGGVNTPQNGTSSDVTGHAWTVTNGFVTGTGLTGATGLKAFLADVASSTTFAANDVLAYNDGTNTYLAIGDHTAGTVLGEHIIELVGLHTATVLGSVGGANTIHLA